MRIIGLSLAFVTLFAAGCSILPQPEDRPVYYFNIGNFDNKKFLNVPVELTSLEFVFSEKTQMAFRDGNNSVLLDEFNRWSDLPSNLLRKRFILVLNNTNPEKNIAFSQARSLDVDIVRFDFDMKKKTANITALFVLRDRDARTVVGRSIIATESKVKMESAAGYAKAMGEAVSEMTKRLVVKLNGIKTNSKTPVKNDKK